jgi:uncharacterized protein YfiM (DUF2279 family)
VKKWLLNIILFCSFQSFASGESFERNGIVIHPAFPMPGSATFSNYSSDSLPQFHVRRKWAAGLSVAAYGSSLIALNHAWYNKFEKTSFHYFNDSGEWLQVDKVGHAWSAYNLSRASAALWRWTGINDRKAIWIGSLSGFSYLTVIEFLDAHSARWGWSWADMGANFMGSALFAGQELTWKEQKIQFKFSAHKKEYDPSLQNRANDLFGSSLPERLLKDYNSQTYWMSFNLRSLTNTSNLPAWLNISIGYGAEGLYGGFENIAYDKNGNITFNRRDIKRYRQWYLSPDIDLTRIKTNSRFLKTAFSIFNSVKIPAPALEFSNGRLRAKAIVF